MIRCILIKLEDSLPLSFNSFIFESGKSQSSSFYFCSPCSFSHYFMMRKINKHFHVPIFHLIRPGPRYVPILFIFPAEASFAFLRAIRTAIFSINFDIFQQYGGLSQVILARFIVDQGTDAFLVVDHSHLRHDDPLDHRIRESTLRTALVSFKSGKLCALALTRVLPEEESDAGPNRY